MVFTQNPVATRVKQPQAAVALLANSNANTPATIMTAGANGSKVVQIVITSNDTVQRNITIAISNSTSNNIVGTVNVAASAGTDGLTASVMAFNSPLVYGLPQDNDGQPYIFVPGSNTISAWSGNTITNAKNVYLTVIYGDF